MKQCIVCDEAAASGSKYCGDNCKAKAYKRRKAGKPIENSAQIRGQECPCCGQYMSAPLAKEVLSKQLGEWGELTADEA